MAKLTSLPKKTNHKVLIYGPPVTGKTTLVGKLAEKFKLIYIGFEQGHTPFYTLPTEWQERIEVINIPDSRSFPVGIQTALKLVKGKEHKVCQAHGVVDCSICNNNGGPFDVVHLNATSSDTIVVWDSLTQLVNSAISHITKGKDDDYKLERDDWGNLGKLMEIFLSHIQAAQYNTICISHELEVEMEDGRKKIVPVSGTANSSRNTARYFDHVVYSYVANMKHNFISNSTSGANMVVGSRTNFDISKNASLMDIFENKIPTAEVKSPGQIAASGLAGLLKK